MTHAVSYVRMSSDKQDASPGQQREAIAKLAEKHGFKLGREYFDGGISGDATEKRTEFQRMIADAGKGGFKAILCWDQSRFGRFNSIEAGYWVFPLVQAGVELVTVTEGRISWNDFTGRMMFAIQAEGKNAFLRDLARNVKRGQTNAAKRGEWMGMAPFGYRLDAKHLVIDETAAPVVRMVYDRYLDGLSLRGVAEQLNLDGIRSPGGSTWSYTTVNKLLNNEAYAGVFRWGVTTESKYIADGDREAIEILDHHEAIVTREEFARAQRKLGERKRRSSPIRNGGDFVLTGLLKCGHCGSPMIAKRLRRGNIQYACSHYQLRGKGVCNPNWVWQEDVLEAVLSTIEKQFLNPTNLDRLRAEIRKQIEEQANPKASERLRKEVAAVDAKLARASKRLLDVESDMVATVQEAIRGLRAERDQLAANLKASETPKSRLAASADKRIALAVDSVSRLRQTLVNDPMRLREVLREAVERIGVKATTYTEGKRTYWRLASGTVQLRGGFVSNLHTAVRRSESPRRRRTARSAIRDNPRRCRVGRVVPGPPP